MICQALIECQGGIMNNSEIGHKIRDYAQGKVGDP